MTTSVSWLVAAILLHGGSPASPAGADDPPRLADVDYNLRCVEGEAERSELFPEMSPTQTAHCEYSRAELVERFARLLEAPEGRLELEQVEAAFGLPRLQTGFDDQRSAWYDVRLKGGEGENGWKASLVFRESFYPLYDFRPPRLTEGRRPEPLDEADRGSIFFSLTLLEPPPDPGSPACIPVSRVTDRALRAGWKDDTASASFATHGGPKSVRFTRGDRTFFPGVRTRGFVVSRAELEHACFSDGRIDQEPTKPEGPLTAEERAFVERRSAESIAKHYHRRWKELPATDEKDRQARDARADFMRDQSLRMSGLTKNPVSEAVAAMTVEELRAFASAAASGSYWSIARELCDAAVGEPDPVAALDRLATARGLDPLEKGIIHSYCFVYVEGRRYQHRQLP